ncbi:hypothetical protein NAC44_20935 [Allorhizobium sp. BGMRC 0089]|nr:hypothetical protein [Allorhizobium sonneratiae]
MPNKIEKLDIFISAMIRAWGDSWTFSITPHDLYITAVLTRKSDRFSLRIAAADRCTVKVLWPSSDEKSSMSAKDWLILAPNEAEPEARFSLSDHPATIADRITKRVIEPGTPLFEMALSRLHEAQRKSANIDKAVQHIIKQLDTVSIQTEQGKSLIYAISPDFDTSASFSLCEGQNEVVIRSKSPADMIKVARLLRECFVRKSEKVCLP